MKHKILFALENYYPKIGGVETLFKNLCEALAQNGYDISVITSGVPGCPESEFINGVKIHRLKVASRYAFTFLAFFEVLKHVSAYDLVHTTSYNAALPAFVAAKLVGKPVFITFHEIWGKLWFALPFLNEFSKLAHYSFEKFIAHLPFDKFIAVSRFTLERLIQEGQERGRIELIYPGMDYEKIENFKLTNSTNKYANFTYTYFGRAGISKGLNILIEAASQTRRRIPSSRLMLILPKETDFVSTRLYNLIDQYGLREYILFKHNLSREALYNEILKSHCVVIPSYSEGFGFSAAEAAALGTPIICSGRGALKEVVSGKFIELKELAPAELTKALVQASQGKFEEKNLKSFELSKCVSAYLGLYEKILS